jgi:beta-lactamase superfamily II metal-dependent hydrolase
VVPNLKIQSVGSDLAVPPLAEEVEISLFGPGFGECVVAHIGESQWIVVDSCIHSASRSPVALEYFRELGVNPRTDVKAIIATHWHDDHMAGLAELFATCPEARFVCSVALNCSEWATLVEIYRGYIQTGGSGVDELRKVMSELSRRSAAGKIAAPDFAIANRTLLERPTKVHAKLVALAPSDAAVALMQTRIQQQLLPQPNSRRLRVPELGENDSSVVLSLSVSNASVLLGADLEDSRRPGLGWQVILDEYRADGLRFEGFKIPHHGSANGFHQDQWPKLMKNDAWATLTPYNRGTKLPTTADCQRILALSPDAYITAPPGLGKFRHPDPAVHKTALEVTVSIGDEPGKQGHVRLRRSAFDKDAKWRVELFGDALPLARVLKLL